MKFLMLEVTSYWHWANDKIPLSHGKCKTSINFTNCVFLKMQKVQIQKIY